MDYYISNTGYAGTYSQFYPSKEVELSGEWVEDTFIMRYFLSEIVIGRYSKPVIYDYLESWFDDSSKFNTAIYIRCKPDGVNWMYWYFGIKYGKLNKTVQTYTITPEPYDFYHLYIQDNLNVEFDDSFASDTVHITKYNDSSTYMPYSDNYDGRLLWDFLLEQINKSTGISTANIVSSILHGDNHEDGTPVSTQYGEILDYVTGEQSFLVSAIIIFHYTNNHGKLTLQKLLDILSYKEIYPSEDSNGKLRFEHRKYYEDILNGTTENLTVVADKAYSYNNPELVVRETTSMKLPDDDTDEDFIGQDIVYSNIRNKTGATKLDHNFGDLYTNYDYFIANAADLLSSVTFLAGCYENSIRQFTLGAGVGLTNDVNYFSVGFYSIGHYIYSNDIYVYVNHDVDCTIVLSALTGGITVKAYLYDRSSSTIVSAQQTLSAGTNTFTLTPFPVSADLQLRIAMTAGTGGTITGYARAIEVTNFGNPDYHHLAWASGKLSTTPKANAVLSLANIQDAYWKHGRTALSATMNGSVQTMESTVPNLEIEPFRIYYAGLPDPMQSYNDGEKVGYLKTFKKNLDTGFCEITLNYQEGA